MAFKHNIVDDLFRRNDELSHAAASEILRLRQIMRSVWGIYYSNDYANDEVRFRAIVRKMHETMEKNPNYPNYY